MQVAIIGSGISGLAAARALAPQMRVTLFEAAPYFGGHAHTVDVTLPTPDGLIRHGIDTGFLVFNHRTYPHLVALLNELSVTCADSEMSFSVQATLPNGKPLQWSGTNLAGLFSQKSNLVRPGFHRMLADLLRFNKLTTGIASRGDESALAQPLGDFLDQHRFGTEFREWYFLPMLACIWSCPTKQMLQFPVSTMVRFCHNHGLLQISNRPQWRTVVGGSKHYVQRMVDSIAHKHLRTPVLKVLRDLRGVQIVTAAGTQRFDKVVFATHSDDTLAMLHAPSALEHEVLSAIRYQTNHAVLHTDARMLPKAKSAWAAWNYENARAANSPQAHTSQARVCLHYLINRLQPLPFEQPVIVSLNPLREIAKHTVLGEYDYAHPVFDLPALRAQGLAAGMQGLQHSYFCGAWMGYGFHEDGLKAGLDAAARVLAHSQAQERMAA